LTQKAYEDTAAVYETPVSEPQPYEPPVPQAPFEPQAVPEAPPSEITGGAGVEIPQEQPTEQLPAEVAGGLGTVSGEGATEGQLPPIEVIGEPTYEGQEFPVSITGEPTGTEEDQTQYAGQTFPSSGIGGKYPTVTYNYFGSPEYRRYLQRRRAMSPLAALSDQSGSLGDLGSGLVWTGQPIDWLQPSVLARGGLVRFKKV
jgi:hypothetical protein